MLEAHEAGLLLWAASTFSSPAMDGKPLIVEFGTNWGHTACLLSMIRGSKVWTIDISHRDRLLIHQQQHKEVLMDNQTGMFAAERGNVVQMIRSPTARLNLSPRLAFDVAFIDGDHRYEAVMRDTEDVICRAHLAKRALLICWHDYHPPSADSNWVGVQKCVDELSASGLQARHVAGTRMAFGVVQFETGKPSGSIPCAILSALQFSTAPSPDVADLFGMPPE